jgi:hypothetical protein
MARSPPWNVALAIILVAMLGWSTAAVSARDHWRLPATSIVDVPPGGDLQAALVQAQPGDTIRLSAGATYTGSFILPSKTGNANITIRTSTSDAQLPAPGSRVKPSDAQLLARVVSAGGSVFTAAQGAHHFRFVGLEIAPTPGTFLYNVVTLGDGSEPTVADQPHDIAFERCYIHGDPTAGSRRAIAMNGRNLSVVDSRLSDFKEVGADSQALAGWSGAGPFMIANNYLEGAGENLMFGGADPGIQDLVPSDIVVRHNHFFKPLAWKVDDPSYAGTHWSVKNLFELKNARRVIVEGNVFEQNWADAQSGFSILFTVRNQDGTAPWSQIDHVTFQNNILRHGGAGFNVLGYDNNFPSQQTNHLTLRNNLLYDISDTWGGNGAFLQMLDGTADVTVDHNSVFHGGNVITGDGRPHTGFVFTNNIAPHNLYGVIGTNHGPGNDSLDVFFPARDFRRNAIAGASASSYPTDNFYPANLSDLKFVDFSAGNYGLASDSPVKSAGTDGKDVGADIGAVEDATCGTINGTYCPSGGSQPPPRSPFDLPTLAIVAAIILAAISIFVLLARRRRRDLMRKR